jgi:hypothetical protein
VIQYYIGPRGKTEVGTHGVEGLVREVYGFGLGSDEGNSEERKEFESKLSKSLGYSKPRTTQAAGAGDDNDDDCRLLFASGGLCILLLRQHNIPFAMNTEVLCKYNEVSESTKPYEWR